MCYLSVRSSADDDLRDLLSEVEYSWLGAWKGVLLGSPSEPEQRDALRRAVTKLSASLGNIAGAQINQHKLEVKHSQTHPVAKNSA